jgi:hypothetical protein
LTLRAFVILIFAMLLMGVWIEYEECFNSGGPLAENAPPNSAVGVVLLLLIISAVLYRFRHNLRLGTAELVVIYTALLVAAPLMTQGMWHRFFGLTAILTHEQDFKTYRSLPEMLWPHGNNLLPNGQFRQGLEGYTHTGGGTLAWKRLRWSNRDRSWDTPVLSNTAATDASAITIDLPRDVNGHVQLRPGEFFLFSALVKAEGLQPSSNYFVKMRADNGRWSNVLLGGGATTPTLADKDGFQLVGACPVRIPTSLSKTLTLTVGLNGPGTLAVQDLHFFNVRATEGAYLGLKVARESTYRQLGEHERDFTLEKPDNMFSLAGLRYLVTGFIPLDQWLRPALAWSILIGALFMGFLGFNVLMRKQWVENERFTFPLNLVPKMLFLGEHDDLTGQVKSLFHNKLMWIGFAVALVYAILKGVNHYIPQVPCFNLSDQWGAPRLDSYFTNPIIKAYLTNVNLSLVLCLFSIMLLVEKDLLFSIWAGFLLFQFMYMFGKLFNFSRFEGYPWEWTQAIGSFITFALLAIFAGRRHLADAIKSALGRLKDAEDGKELFSYRTALLLIFLSLGIIIAWGMWTNMGWLAALLYFGFILVCGFSASKIRAECGAPFGYWMPYFGMSFVSALGGFAVFGSTGMLVATIASGFMCVSCFLFIAPVQVEMMELGRACNVRPRDITWGLVLGLLGGLFVGGFVLLVWVYGFGADNLRYSWPYGQGWYFNNFRGLEMAADKAVATGSSLISKANQPLNVIYNVDAKGIGIGAVVTLILAGLRSTFMWFPLHPIGYVLATTFFARTMWFSAFLAWLTRSLVLRIGGAHSIRKGLVPVSVGLFLGCIVSIFLFDVVSMFLQAHGVTDVYNGWP